MQKTCLFFYGGSSFPKKPAKFHDEGWEKQLKAREDCEVVKMKTGHWLVTEQPELVIEKMAAWLDKALPALAAGPLAAL